LTAPPTLLDRFRCRLWTLPLTFLVLFAFIVVAGFYLLFFAMEWGTLGRECWILVSDVTGRPYFPYESMEEFEDSLESPEDFPRPHPTYDLPVASRWGKAVFLYAVLFAFAASLLHLLLPRFFRSPLRYLTFIHLMVLSIGLVPLLWWGHKHFRAWRFARALREAPITDIQIELVEDGFWDPKILMRFVAGEWKDEEEGFRRPRSRGEWSICEFPELTMDVEISTTQMERLRERILASGFLTLPGRWASPGRGGKHPWIVIHAGSRRFGLYRYVFGGDPFWEICNRLQGLASEQFDLAHWQLRAVDFLEKAIRTSADPERVRGAAYWLELLTEPSGDSPRETVCPGFEPACADSMRIEELRSCTRVWERRHRREFPVKKTYFFRSVHRSWEGSLSMVQNGHFDNEDE
jgi:hypothetical protein